MAISTARTDAARPVRAAVDRLLARRWLLPAAIGAIAFAIRIGVLLRGGGLLGYGDYDDGVYYAAGAALVHGRLPYADFLFLQPPGITLVVAPFAALGSLTSDQIGLIAARLAFELVGGLNAALVVVILRRFSTAAAATGGVLYAVLLSAVWAERSVLLEPLGTLGLLVSLVLLGRTPSRRLLLLAGLAAGWAVDVKIWYVVPVAVILLFAPRPRWRFMLGAAVAVVAVWLPFLVAAPTAMVREVLLDQLGRPRTTRLLVRLAGILDAHAVAGVGLRAVTVVLLVLAVVAVVLALLTRRARVFGVLLAADMVVLVASPSYYAHYGALTAPPLALCAGIAVQRILGVLRAGPRTRALLAAGVCALLLAAGLQVDDQRRSGEALPPAFTRAAASVTGCITADDPTALIVTGVLTRDLDDASCVVWPDVTGWTYDRADERTASGHAVPRARNQRWQRLLLTFLRSGDAVLTVRPTTGISARTRQALEVRPPLAAAGHASLHRTRRT